ncbi:MAG: hypothetical protein ACLT49_07285 [Sutterella wadsworthensis]
MDCHVFRAVPPYHKMGIAVAVITTVAFSIILSHDVVFEAPVAVIDLDQSRWSAELIEKQCLVLYAG